jgi:plastocyanin
MITPSGGTFSFTFMQPGTYTYHCTVHPYMKGTIVVTG